jgi:glycosyltransferase involved in cell wall biosynthesis
MNIFSKKISVAMCTCNGEKYLNEQLHSILNQSYKPDELIICDDCSTDNTIRIIKSYSAEYPGSISVHLNEKNLGAIKNFEKAISLTTGDFIFLSDQDDIWYPDKIKKIIPLLNKSNILLIFSNGDLIDEKGTEIGSTLWEKWNFTEDIRENWRNNKLAFHDLLRIHNKVTGATVAFKKKLKKYIIPVNVPHNYWHDQWFALHAAALNGLSFTEEPLIKYRIHTNQQIGLPESNQPINNASTFNESVSIEEFYSFIEKKYNRLFNKNSSYSVILLRIYRFLIKTFVFIKRLPDKLILLIKH